jgi:hypothetical protein
MSLAAMNDKYGLPIDLVFIVAIWAGIACAFVAPAIALFIVTAAGIGAGAIGMAQVAIISTEST